VTPPNPKVDAFVRRAGAWRAEIEKLRTILRACGLDEELKWGKPCYAHGGRNVAIIQPFKAHCALLFFKGALLEDTHGMLRRQGAHTRSALRLEFTSAAEIRKAAVTSYVRQAIALETTGARVEVPAAREAELPAELTQALAKNRPFAKAFDALTPGRRRGWILHVVGAKRPETRIARIEKARPLILAGRGPND
jgi:uncharacterized protein YdeI (YjbR/CyaY-like superfamily)